MPKPRDCQAQQHSDQMICAKCGLAWDVSDPDIPACNPSRTPTKVEISAPVTLPDKVAGEMVKAYNANAGGIRGMQSAYRLFLDRVDL